jgi:hypothetical protein
VKQWVIMGAYEEIGSALICVLPLGRDEAYAAHVVKRMTLNPSHAERIMIGDAKIIWAEEVEADEAWWDDNCD